MLFDPKDSRFKPLLKYMKGKTCLVYDPVLTVRQSIIRLMQSFELQGIDVTNDGKDFHSHSDNFRRIEGSST